MTVPNSPAEITAPRRIRTAVHAALDTKAEDVRVRFVEPVADFADYFLIASGGSERQVQAIADRIEASLREAGSRPLHVEGYAAGQWILLDYGDFIAHVFLDDRRRHYGLERLWADAPDVTSDYSP
jgi:ribosome-associated protein